MLLSVRKHPVMGAYWNYLDGVSVIHEHPLKGLSVAQWRAHSAVLQKFDELDKDGRKVMAYYKAHSDVCKALNIKVG